jgi:hypothetical protein
LDILLALVRCCHQGIFFEEGTSSSGVIAWCGFINDIVSFTWISKRVQYSSMVGTRGVDVGLPNQVCNLYSFILYFKHYNYIVCYYVIYA